MSPGAAALVASGGDEVTAHGLAILAAPIGTPCVFVIVCEHSIDAIASNLVVHWAPWAPSFAEMRESLQP